jgi:hypothetical protein
VRHADRSSRGVLPRVVYLTGCDRESSIMKRPWSTRGCCFMAGDMCSTVTLLTYRMYTSNYLLESSVENRPEEHTFSQFSACS